MRGASEMPHVKGITTLGPRNMGAVGHKDWEVARAHGTHLASLRHIPDGERVYLPLDINAFDPSIAPGTGTISHGGFTYYEVRDILKELA
jgi:agmatinase